MITLVRCNKFFLVMNCANTPIKIIEDPVNKPFRAGAKLIAQLKAEATYPKNIAPVNLGSTRRFLLK